MVMRVSWYLEVDVLIDSGNLSGFRVVGFLRWLAIIQCMRNNRSRKSKKKKIPFLYLSPLCSISIKLKPTLNIALSIGSRHS